MSRSSSIVAAVLLTATVAGCHHAAPATPVTAPVRIAAAADMAAALDEIGPAFARQSGRAVARTIGASGLLERQIIEGAPFDVFLSANASFVDDLVKNGHAVAASRFRFARGRVVIWTPPSVSPPPTVEGLADARFARIAIANPDHAPYGAAAMAALGHAGIVETVRGRLVRAENVQVALSYAQSGNADAALVARALVTKLPGHSVLLDMAPEQPLDQTAVVVQGSHDPEGAAAFIAFLRGSEGRAILARYGFELP